MWKARGELGIERRVERVGVYRGRKRVREIEGQREKEKVGGREG